jgi:hypothetical protein
MPRNQFARPSPHPDIFIPCGGGAAFKLAAVSVIERGDVFEVERPGVDISLIDPERVVTFRSRPVTELDLIDLHTFLTAASLDAVPEVSAPTFQSLGLGLVLSVPLSEETRVDVNVVVTVVAQGLIVDTEEFRFTTTRTAVLLAADRVQKVGAVFGFAVGQTPDFGPEIFATSDDQKGSE